MEDALLLIAALGALLAALGTLFNSWQIARLTGRVDGLERTTQTVLTLIAGRAPDSTTRTGG